MLPSIRSLGYRANDLSRFSSQIGVSAGKKSSENDRPKLTFDMTQDCKPKSRLETCTIASPKTPNTKNPNDKTKQGDRARIVSPALLSCSPPQMLLNGGGGSRSALRPRSSANDENALVGGATSKGLGLSAKTPGGGGSNANNKPTVRLALGPAKSLEANGPGGGGGIVAKTPGPSHARRRAFGDISNRKAGRGPGHPTNAAAGAGAKTPKAVSFQSNLFAPPPAKTPGGLANGGGKSAKKKGLQLQKQRTPFVSRNANANASTHPNRSVSFEPSSSSTIKLPSNAVMPMSSRKEKASSSSSTVVPRTTVTAVVQDQVIDEDDGGGSVSSVELPAGGRIWDPSDFFGDDESYDLAAKIAAVNTSLDDDPSFVMPTFPSKAAAGTGTDDADDGLLAKEMEELEKEDYETLDHLLNDFAPADDDGYGEDDLLSGLTPSLDDHDDGLGLLLDDLDDLALA